MPAKEPSAFSCSIWVLESLLQQVENSSTEMNALSLALFHGVQRRRLAQSPNGDEGRQQAVLRRF